MSITVQQVSKKFGNQLALDSVSFQIGSGEIAAFIGPNGAGKSTLMKIICGLLEPDQGEIKVRDEDIRKNSRAIRKQLGYLPENNPLYPDMYVEEYLHHVAGLYQLRHTRQRVQEVVALTGLQPEKHKKIGVLSKGYKQRVGLAQAIIHDPAVLILDEPTAGLDPNQLVEIRNLISGLGKEKTVMLSTHIMQEVEAICQRVIIISKGKIMADDLTGNIRTLDPNKIKTVVIEFSQDPSENIFAEIPAIENTRKLTTGTWLVETSGSLDIREELFRLSVKHNLVILSMHTQNRKLEDVFRELTS
jgi:ABC-2 type transport system ATP-binding protein